MRFNPILIVVAFASVVFTPVIVRAQLANHIVISEVYGGGGNSGATIKNDFIELYNPTDLPVSLAGWSVQYSSATGTSTWQVTGLTGTIAAHRFYLVQEAQGSGGTVNLPTPDDVGTLTLSANAGKVALVNTTVALTGAVSTGPTIVDMVGFGSTANAYEGAGPAPGPTNTSSIERKATLASSSAMMAVGGTDAMLGNGWDSGSNADDFLPRSSPQPQNSSSPVEPALPPNGSGIGTASAAPTRVDAAATFDLSVTVTSDTSGTIAKIFIQVPALVSWSKNPSAVSLVGSSLSGSVVAVEGDTLKITGAAVTSANSGGIVIHSLTAPDSAVALTFIVRTAVDTVDPAPIMEQPQIRVTKLVRIIDLHVNDSQGVPAAPYTEGSLVTVSGIVTDITSSTQTNLFVQDATGGINIFNYTYFPDFQVGDSVTLTGVIDQYRGTTEVVPDSGGWTIHAHGRPLPTPLLLTAADVNQTFNDDFTEPNEGRLVRVNGVTYNSTNLTITDVTGTSGGYISSSLNIPAGTFDLIGILKQYKPGTSSTLTPPYTADYEVAARTQEDIITHSGPVFTVAPSEGNLLPSSVTISFKTASSATAVVKYGISPSYTDSVVVSSPDTSHAIVLGGLLPATVYHYQAVATDQSGTNYTGDAMFSTASPEGSTGTIDVFFSKSTDASVSAGENAQTVDISSRFISRINAAEHSIDVALYSLSGTVGSNIANALIAARDRGVKVRMIVEYDNSNSSPMNTMKSSGIPFITDKFDPVNAGNGYMHNKFAVFDFRDTSSFTDDWVWTGSWNATDPGTNNDAQNALEIQDKSLANAYTMEFNEMWGSDSDTANSSSSRFGARKTDNTPHHFNIGGIPVELYFSPSDQTTLHIYNELNRATLSINICMLTFTRTDLADALISKKAAGKKVRVVLDTDTDNGNQYSALSGGGVDIHLKGSALTGLLHHKYALIDAEDPKADDVVITGSHNWSNSAETSNNENTLIIHSARIANLYLQEFKSRYVEAGGTDEIVLGMKDDEGAIPSGYSLGQNYPNPFNPSTVIRYQLSAVSHVTLRVYDVLGREIRTLVNEKQGAGIHAVNFDAAQLPSGVYFYRISAGKFSETKKLVLIK